MIKTYDIVILPPAEISRKLSLSLHRAVDGLPMMFVVDGKKLRYHMSLYHLRLTPAHLVQAVSRIENSLKAYHPFKVRSKSLYFHSSKVFSIEFARNKIWENMEADIVGAIKNLRSGSILWEYDRKPSKIELEFRRKYGSSYLHPLTKPHFTLGRGVDSDFGESIKKKFRDPRFSFLANTVAICEVNNNNQATKIIKKFKLQK